MERMSARERMSEAEYDAYATAQQIRRRMRLEKERAEEEREDEYLGD
jgi:hypothetical protein